MKLYTLPAECKSLDDKIPPFVAKEVGNWLILNDLHIPYHDDATVELALREAQNLKVSGILINGDLIDSAQLSRHAKHRSGKLYKVEVEMAKAFLLSVRKTFPKATILYKAGNHEERLDSYILTHAEALEGMVDLASFLDLDELGITWIQDKRIVKLGKLNVFHGHEFGGGSGGANVARWLLLRTGGGTAAACGHFHRTDSAGARNSNDFLSATWGIGCACKLDPFWLAQNQWNLGYATVQVAKGGDFQFTNRRIIHGRVYST